MSATTPTPWPVDEAHPRPSPSEMERRWTALRSMIAEKGADGLVVAGHAAGRAEIQHLTNVPVRWESLLVVPADGDPVLLLQLDNHAAGAAAWSTVPVEVSGPDIAGAVAGRLRDPNGAQRPVALLGPLSERIGSRLRKVLGERPFVDLGPAFLRHRLIKSDEELAWTRWAATLCDEALATFLDRARPGLRDDELGAILETAVVAAGGQLGICFLATASMIDGGAAVPDQTWSRRRTSPEDLAMFELSAGMGGVTAQLLRTVTLGGEPTPRIRRMHDIADETFEALLATVRPGRPAAELEAIGGRCIEGAGLTIIDDMVHGYGGGYLPPVLRTPGTRRAPLPDLVLEQGMLLVLQPNVVTVDRRHGVQTGELVVVTEDGAESMHAAARGLLQATGRVRPNHPTDPGGSLDTTRA